MFILKNMFKTAPEKKTVEAFPADAAVDKPIPEPVLPCVEMRLSGLSILIIEDSEQILEILTAYLTKYGASVDYAENGQAGFEKYCRNPGTYDVVLMDLQMPVLGGHEALLRIRSSGLENAATLPVVIMTGSSDYSEYKEIDNVYKLRKPFMMDTMKKLICSILSDT